MDVTGENSKQTETHGKLNVAALISLFSKADQVPLPTYTPNYQKKVSKQEEKCSPFTTIRIPEPVKVSSKEEDNTALPNCEEKIVRNTVVEVLNTSLGSSIVLSEGTNEKLSISSESDSSFFIVEEDKTEVSPCSSMKEFLDGSTCEIRVVSPDVDPSSYTAKFLKSPRDETSTSATNEESSAPSDNISSSYTARFFKSIDDVITDIFTRESDSESSTSTAEISGSNKPAPYFGYTAQFFKPKEDVTSDYTLEPHSLNSELSPDTSVKILAKREHSTTSPSFSYTAQFFKDREDALEISPIGFSGHIPTTSSNYTEKFFKTLTSDSGTDTNPDSSKISTYSSYTEQFFKDRKDVMLDENTEKSFDCTHSGTLTSELNTATTTSSVSYTEQFFKNREDVILDENTEHISPAMEASKNLYDALNSTSVAEGFSEHKPTTSSNYTEQFFKTLTSKLNRDSTVESSYLGSSNTSTTNQEEEIIDENTEHLSRVMEILEPLHELKKSTPVAEGFSTHIPITFSNYTEKFFKSLTDEKSTLPSELNSEHLNPTGEVSVNSYDDQQGGFCPLNSIPIVEGFSEHKPTTYSNYTEQFFKTLTEEKQNTSTAADLANAKEMCIDYDKPSTSCDSNNANVGNSEDDRSSTPDEDVSTQEEEPSKDWSPFKDPNEFPEGWKGKMPLWKKCFPKKAKRNEDKLSVSIPEEHLPNWNINPCVNFERLTENQMPPPWSEDEAFSLVNTMTMPTNCEAEEPSSPIKWESCFDNYFPEGWDINPLQNFVEFLENFQLGSSRDTYISEHWNINPILDFVGFPEDFQDRFSNDTLEHWNINPLLDFVGFPEDLQNRFSSDTSEQWKIDPLLDFVAFPEWQHKSLCETYFPEQSNINPSQDFVAISEYHQDLSSILDSSDSNPSKRTKCGDEKEQLQRDRLRRTHENMLNYVKTLMESTQGTE